ncbi:hypothetical protein D3C85_1702400 [compost metagenome]
MTKYRLSDTYVEDIRKLVGLLIDKNTDDIIEDVMNTESENTTFTQDELDFIDDSLDMLFA